ncbi:MAG: trypsin-like peptidase domain-containing protein [Chitinophaga sp.]|uniref:S1 family peptidase n=1 Tax=Chitinophaga sp. TaxID=1869181 RepID=UPI001B11F13E|nr:serine protease [Chitinophaga sp.]MBO9728409.1 trypsin-like peptidase domain-containing protein [Chitinophaga sp.]
MKETLLALILCFLNLNCMSQSYKSLKEALFSSTTKIEIANTAGQITTGTGFFFSYVIGSDTLFTLITNYHVVANTKSVRLTLTHQKKTGGPDYGKHSTFTVSDANWIKHPSEDLAMIILTRQLQEQFENKFNAEIYFSCFSEGNIPNQSNIKKLQAIEDVLMIGYPVGFYDKYNNLPIIRRGITSTPYFVDYENQKRFLLDIAIFPGSSGSPVMLSNELSAINAEQYSLLGIACGTITKPDSSALNIGVAIKSECLLDFKPIIKSVIDANNK